MYKTIKKLFGGMNLTWPKVIIAAVIAGVLTAVMAIIPGLHDTSFTAITVTFEVWILFGIIIIMNSRSNLDAALKCFVFFLISQPIVYLIQVPFSWQGWGLFGYYRYWFIWTILCLPMGFIGYYMKKNRWWGYLILFPMILYPVLIFDNRNIQKAGAVIGGAAVIAATAICLMNPPVYSTEIMGNGDEYVFDDTYSVRLDDDSYGDVQIIRMDSIDAYMVHADFKRAGRTILTLEAPSGEKTEYDIYIERNTYKVSKRFEDKDEKDQ